MAKSRIETTYICQQCQYQTKAWMGRCPECGSWNSLVETNITPSPIARESQKSFGESKIYSLSAIPQKDLERVKTDFSELDHVLGGGIVGGSVVLVAGEPGIGKSTLLLQVADSVARGQKAPVLYVSGEESARQIKLRADRMGINNEQILILPENNIESILSHISATKPCFIIVDSIQTMFTDALTGVAGSVGQVRESASAILRLVKSEHIPTFIIGHVTKEGTVAGPKVLEHIVDVVLLLEGDLFHNYRIVRTSKNRFGPTSEVGIFEMKNEGMVEVKNPSQFFLNENKENTPGSVVVATLEGERPILAEIQALVAPTSLAMPRRTAVGIDYNRVVVLAAVLSKRLGLNIGNSDIYVNVVGGLKLREPSIDLAICLAIISSLKNKPIDAGTVVFGEVGLLGEVRKVSRSDKRIQESKRLGFTKFITSDTIVNLNQAVKQAFSD